MHLRPGLLAPDAMVFAVVPGTTGQRGLSPLPRDLALGGPTAFRFHGHHNVPIGLARKRRSRLVGVGALYSVLAHQHLH